MASWSSRADASPSSGAYAVSLGVILYETVAGRPRRGEVTASRVLVVATALRVAAILPGAKTVHDCVPESWSLI
jgi:hypothetical protein